MAAVPPVRPSKRKQHQTSPSPGPSASSSHAPTRSETLQSSISKPQKAISKTSEKKALQRQKAMDRAIARAVRESADTIQEQQSTSLPVQPPVQSPGAPLTLSPDISVDSSQPLPNSDLFCPISVSEMEVLPAAPPVLESAEVPSSATIPMGPVSHQAVAPVANDPAVMAEMIAAAVQRGITASRQTRTHSWVSEYVASQTSHDLVQDYSTPQAEDFQAHSPSRASLGDEGDLRDENLSEDEDLVPDQPSFVGLFNPQLFRSLLHKAKVTTRLGVARPAPIPTSETTDPPMDLFSVPWSSQKRCLPPSSLWK
ncbi:mucin-5AC-like [Ahaetulla prasina]|uniref:mucin-5AC-like n=1 Tax=Ahaetulla prasina TaxID=499056 RepID=UPI002648DFAB|nr:mucin-5AC-like [Ahaetulla prasina]XP_058018159.1 mucin-5AC-like [Ahaetulla prasina]